MPESTARRPASGPAASLGETLADWASGLRYEDLPAPVVADAKRLLLDTLAVAWAGSAEAGVEPLRGLVRAQGGTAESGIWAFGERATATQAALVNGTMAAALDFDSVHDVGTVHADAVVLPAVLALAERGRLGGKEFLAAYVAGDEMLVRLGLAVRTHPGWFYSSVLGVFAAAAAAARALRLDAVRTQAALGIALSRAAGTQQALVERSLVKRMQTAFAARDGVEAALLAEAGITAPAQVFEGACGFEALYTALDAGRVLGGLGREWSLAGVTLKKYASCFCNHAAIEGAFALLRQGARAADAADIAVRVSPFMQRLVGAPFDPGDNPQVAAQFSVQYSVANVLLRGRFELGDMQPAAVSEPAVVALARRVRVEVDPAYTGKFVPATVTVRTRGGAELAATVEALPGTPARPMTAAELRVKALACFGGGARPLASTAAARVVGRIETVEALKDITQLMEA